MKQGEFLSVRQAAIAAGIVKSKKLGPTREREESIRNG
jgi:hypothetical protein